MTISSQSSSPGTSPLAQLEGLTPKTALPKRALITSALPYANGRPHVGHVAGAYLPADTYVRYLRLRGVPVRFVCGSDDYGVAIVASAAKEGKTPAELAKFYSARQHEDFAALGIEFDVYGSTSQNPYQTETAQHFFLKLFERGCFEKKRSPQFYDESKAMFLPDRFVKGRCGYCGTAEQNGDQCEQCGKILDVEHLHDARSTLSGQPATVRDTVHWFLDLSKFEEQVRGWLETAVLREHTRSYVLGLLSTGLVKRSMTRDLAWGIPVPLDDPDAKDKVLYVWFDAPVGYISNTKQLCAERDGSADRFGEWWKDPETAIFHFIGEDNTIFHAVIWIAMLGAEGSYQLPRGVIVNHFLNMQLPGRDVEKMSKSRGTVVSIGDFLAQGGNPEVLRYYLTVVAPERARSTYQPDDLERRYDSDLANVLGNFVHRVLSFTHRFIGPAVPEVDPAACDDVDREFIGALGQTYLAASDLLAEFSFRTALERIIEFCRACNGYLETKAPWTSRKTDMTKTKATLALSLQAVNFFGVALAPFMPGTAAKIRQMIGCDAEPTAWEHAVRILPAGHPLREPVVMFPKAEEPKK